MLRLRTTLDGLLCQGFNKSLMSRYWSWQVGVYPKLSFLFPCNRLSGQDFVVLQRLMKEQIEDVQVNQNPDEKLKNSI